MTFNEWVELIKSCFKRMKLFINEQNETNLTKYIDVFSSSIFNEKLF
jgi:hypothetical protein